VASLVVLRGFGEFYHSLAEVLRKTDVEADHRHTVNLSSRPVGVVVDENADAALGGQPVNGMFDDVLQVLGTTRFWTKAALRRHHPLHYPGRSCDPPIAQAGGFSTGFCGMGLG
jgi:hypothetical protein